MKGKGLSFDVIVDAAMKLVNEKGYNQFSVRELAASLHVKAASHYNHLDGIDQINVEIGRIATEEMNGELEAALTGKSRDEALYAIGLAYRNFVLKNHELYLAILGMPSLDKGDEAIISAGRDSAIVIRKVLNQYRISHEEKVHFSRSFRSAMTGFATMEMSGYFTSQNIPVDDSFEFLLRGFVMWINRIEQEDRNRALKASHP